MISKGVGGIITHPEWHPRDKRPRFKLIFVRRENFTGKCGKSTHRPQECRIWWFCGRGFFDRDGGTLFHCWQKTEKAILETHVSSRPQRNASRAMQRAVYVAELTSAADAILRPFQSWSSQQWNNVPASFIHKFTLFPEMGYVFWLKIGRRIWKSDAETGNSKLEIG